MKPVDLPSRGLTKLRLPVFPGFRGGKELIFSLDFEPANANSVDTSSALCLSLTSYSRYPFIGEVDIGTHNRSQPLGAVALCFSPNEGYFIVRIRLMVGKAVIMLRSGNWKELSAIIFRRLGGILGKAMNVLKQKLNLGAC